MVSFKYYILPTNFPLIHDLGVTRMNELITLSVGIHNQAIDASYKLNG